MALEINGYGTTINIPTTPGEIRASTTQPKTLGRAEIAEFVTRARALLEEIERRDFELVEMARKAAGAEYDRARPDLESCPDPSVAKAWDEGRASHIAALVRPLARDWAPARALLDVLGRAPRRDDDAVVLANARRMSSVMLMDRQERALGDGWRLTALDAEELRKIVDAQFGPSKPGAVASRAAAVWADAHKRAVAAIIDREKKTNEMVSELRGYVRALVAERFRHEIAADPRTWSLFR